jgi:hypothetical protein
MDAKCPLADHEINKLPLCTWEVVVIAVLLWDPYECIKALKRSQEALYCGKGIASVYV